MPAQSCTSYFASCTSLEELKKAYRRLAMLHHPDVGGDTATMQAINAEYEQCFNRLQGIHNRQQAKQGKPESQEKAEEFIAVIEKIIGLEGLSIEICGTWLWVGGNTYDHKDVLKAAGLKYSGSKKKWYWHPPEKRKKWYRGHYSMDKIRKTYGSEVIKDETAA